MKVTAEHSTDREDSRSKVRRSAKALAAAMILRAFLDYHAAKKLIQKKKLSPQAVRNNKLRFLTDYETEMLLNGKNAWEWITRPPLDIHMPDRLTFQQCVDTLEWTNKDIETMFKPQAFRDYIKATGRQIAGYA